MKLVLQTRDIHLLKFVFACRAVTYDQIARRHFQNVSDTVVRRRLKALTKAGYLKTTVIELFDKVVKAVQPQPKIWEAIQDKWPFEIENPHFKTESLEHDVRLANLFLRLEKLNCFRSFMTENLMVSSKALANDSTYESATRIHSDGVLTVIGADGKFQTYAVEMEISKKVPGRYTQKLIEYYISQGLDGVLYVTPDNEVQRVLAKSDLEVGADRDPFVYFADEKDVNSSQSIITFKNRKEQILVFK